MTPTTSRNMVKNRVFNSLMINNNGNLFWVKVAQYQDRLVMFVKAIFWLMKAKDPRVIARSIMSIIRLYYLCVKTLTCWHFPDFCQDTIDMILLFGVIITFDAVKSNSYINMIIQDAWIRTRICMNMLTFYCSNKPFGVASI